MLINNSDIRSRMTSISRRVFPLYSKRRLFAKLSFNFLRHPFKFLSKITPGRIVTFFDVLNQEGTAGVTRRVNIHMFNYEKQKISLQIQSINMSNLNKISDYQAIVFEKVDNPLVSIIIPVYNRFEYTYNCLKSIISHSNNRVSYEIIIADDCSNDLTTEMGKIIINIKIIRTSKNLRFIKNCNNASKYAKGKYILFLNNDTQVQENWLLSMFELIENDDSIGAVGSKFVYGNGKLQEAGGILWNDSSAFNYGRMKDPTLPEFNYVKEVDYISAASLMIRKSIWDSLGGFDENYILAYCEDSDICFSIRKLGFRVMYQPASVVVHFEGISNGSDIIQGQKQYQIVNQKKFFDKWKKVLKKENSPSDEDIFLARDRSRNKKSILVIDRCVPLFDKDAGSKSVFQYLKLFKELKFNIKFIGNDFLMHEPYTSILQQMGIEVLYGQYYAQNWKKWLRANGRYFNFVFLNRPYISLEYINTLKEETPAKIIYYGHDLHFLREFREYAITNNRTMLRSSEKAKKVELAIMKKSDIVYYPSAYEIDLIKEMDSSINCKLLPVIIFPKNEYLVFDNNRKDLLFVGGFEHTPNVDGILWFIEKILPIVQKSIPEIILNIIGSNAPERVKKFENNEIRILGYVEDGALEKLYKECRVCIAPLRFGAGVKGKIIEGMYKQIPIITTTIGAEGLPGIEDCLVIEDRCEEFAGKIIEMYNNAQFLSALAKNGHNYVMKNFTVDKARSIIKEDFVSDKYELMESCK